MVLIVGGGPAGYTAALYAARAGLSVAVFEKMAAGGQMALTSEIENYPGFSDGVDGIALGREMKQGAERFGTVTCQTEVLSLHLQPKLKQVQTTLGTFWGRTVILATGAEHRTLNLAHERELVGRGVCYCAVCDGMLYRNKTVAVVGGGNSAVSDVLFLSKICKKVYLIHRRDTLRASHSLSLALESADRVEVLWNTRVTELCFEKKLTGVRLEHLSDGTTELLPLDGLFISIGRAPMTQLFSEEITLDADGYAVADETTKTNVPGVFAAGDVRTKSLRQIVTAVSDGAVAAHFAELYLSQN